jgi:hypothetical protein
MDRGFAIALLHTSSMSKELAVKKRWTSIIDMHMRDGVTGWAKILPHSHATRPQLATLT